MNSASASWIFHEPSELGGLGQLALADDLAVRLEQTHHLAGLLAPICPAQREG
jgi:hypothetical protein